VWLCRRGLEHINNALADFKSGLWLLLKLDLWNLPIRARIVFLKLGREVNIYFADREGLFLLRGTKDFRFLNRLAGDQAVFFLGVCY
jgi:hypothetical protein